MERRAEVSHEAAPTPVASPGLEGIVDDLLVGELEESLSPEDLNRTKAAVLDWLFEELSESMGLDEPLPQTAKEEPEIEAAPTETSPRAGSGGFLSSEEGGGKGPVSGMRTAFTQGASKTTRTSSRGRTVAWVLFLVVGLPLGLMAALGPLASAGIYVEALRPLWQPWPPDSAKVPLGVAGFVATLAYLGYRFVRKPAGRPKGTSVEADASELPPPLEAADGNGTEP